MLTSAYDPLPTRVLGRSLRTMQPRDLAERLGERAATVAAAGVEAVEKYCSPTQRAELFTFMVGLSAYAYELSFLRLNSDLADHSDAYSAGVIATAKRLFETGIGAWADPEQTFDEKIEDEWAEADSVWPLYLKYVRLNDGHLAFSRALKEAFLWEGDSRMRTCANLATAVVVEDLVSLRA